MLVARALSAIEKKHARRTRWQQKRSKLAARVGHFQVGKGDVDERGSREKAEKCGKK